MLAKLKSRKLWIAVLGGALAAFGGALGIPPEATEKILDLFKVYLIGESAADAAGAVGISDAIKGFLKK